MLVFAVRWFENWRCIIIEGAGESGGEISGMVRVKSIGKRPALNPGGEGCQRERGESVLEDRRTVLCLEGKTILTGLARTCCEALRDRTHF